MLTDAFANTVVMRSIALSGLALLVCACTTKPGYYPVSEVLPEGDPRWNGCQIMLYPVDEPGVRAGSRFGRDGKKIACNTPPKSLAGPTEAVPIGSGPGCRCSNSFKDSFNASHCFFASPFNAALTFDAGAMY